MEELIEFLATTEGEGGTPTDTIETGTPVVETEAPQGTEGTAQTEPQAPEISKYNIDGEEFTVEEIREWRKSGLRQSDYTRKTQELANQRKANQEALEVYEYLMKNPTLVQKLVEMDTENPVQAETVKGKLDPVQKQIQDLQTQLRVKDIDAELNAITSKDKLVTDVELLEIATKQNVDINTAYKMWKGDNFDRIMAEKEKELTKKIQESIQKNAEVTKTLITPTDKTPDTENYGLSDTELAFAERLGMTAKDYAVYKNPNYKMK